jgi:nucleotide-binding universal stress UspA family protein
MSSRFIVVGVDGSSESRNALRWAVAEAQRRRAAVRVVHAWWAVPELEPGTSVSDDADWDVLRNTEAPRCVEEFVNDALGVDRAKVEIVVDAVQGVIPAAALIAASREADLLVVGSRGLGGFNGLLLGSVSQQCARDAPCPVVVVRGDQPRQTL